MSSIFGSSVARQRTEQILLMLISWIKLWYTKVSTVKTGSHNGIWECSWMIAWILLEAANKPGCAQNESSLENSINKTVLSDENQEKFFEDTKTHNLYDIYYSSVEN